MDLEILKAKLALANAQVALYAAWDESEHPRHPAGTEDGGEFAAKVGAWSSGKINKALDKLDEEDSKITSEFISTGRGHEKPTEYLKATDPLAMRARSVYGRKTILRREVERRYGPGAPYRLPKGFGPIKV